MYALYHVPCSLLPAPCTCTIMRTGRRLDCLCSLTGGLCPIPPPRLAWAGSGAWVASCLQLTLLPRLTPDTYSTKTVSLRQPPSSFKPQCFYASMLLCLYSTPTPDSPSTRQAHVSLSLSLCWTDSEGLILVLVPGLLELGTGVTGWAGNSQKKWVLVSGTRLISPRLNVRMNELMNECTAKRCRLQVAGTGTGTGTGTCACAYDTSNATLQRESPSPISQPIDPSKLPSPMPGEKARGGQSGNLG